MRLFRLDLCLTSLVLCLGACSPSGFQQPQDSPWAPGVDPKGRAVDGLVVGHRLMAAQQYELALDAYIRAAGQDGLTPDVLTSLGSANLALGRLHQSEDLLRQAIKKEPDWPEAWNNLGVVLMELDKTAEAVEVFRRAFALDNGRSDSIRDNLRLALAKLDHINYNPPSEQEFKLVRRGSGSYLVSRN